MDLLLILTYSSICVVIFKVFKIPLNKWTLPTAVLGGVLLIGTLIFLMNYNHPYAEIGREYVVTTPIVPAVNGTVVSVSAMPHVELKQGDVLFNIDPVPFKARVDSLTAQIELAKDDAARARKLLVSNNISQRDAEATFTRLADLEGQLATAQFDLDQTTVRAPTDGYITQMTLRPGIRAVAIPLRPVMVFVNKESLYFVGWFRQNSLLRLTVGDEAEVAYDGIPGKVFTGKVVMVMPALAEGQVQASGTLVSPLTAPYPGRIGVRIEITDPDFEAYRDKVPGGAYAQAALYSKHFRHVAIMRKVLLRMSAWMNYLFPFH